MVIPNKFLLLSKALMFLLLASGGVTLAADRPLPAKPHIVVDLESGAVISHEKAHVRWAPASITKMMTAYTVFRALKLQHLALNSPVRISEDALAEPPTKMGFPIGTILTIDAALKIIMVKSANDVSVALAESVAGSEEAFVGFMNAHARRLGMNDSNFENPHGLHEPGQYSSARDLAVLSMAITKEFPEYASYFDIPAIRVGKRRLRNHNALLRLFDGTTGLKTGYVCASGYNVAVRTTRDGRTLIAVVLGGTSGLERNVRAARVLSEGFAQDSQADDILLTDFRGDDEREKVTADITFEICPRKYAATAKPADRPRDAPKIASAEKQKQVQGDERGLGAKKATGEIAIPVASPERPELKTKQKIVSANAAAITDSGDTPVEKVPEDEPPTLKELFAIYLAPRSDLREIEQVSLAGATGPNPFGIKHTDGGVYKPPLPVPEMRPPLDSDKSG